MVPRIVVNVDGHAAEGRDFGRELVEARIVLALALVGVAHGGAVVVAGLFGLAGWQSVGWLAIWIRRRRGFGVLGGRGSRGARTSEWYASRGGEGGVGKANAAMIMRRLACLVYGGRLVEGGWMGCLLSSSRSVGRSVVVGRSLAVDGDGCSRFAVCCCCWVEAALSLSSSSF
jgi:hypothetical protein